MSLDEFNILIPDELEAVKSLRSEIGKHMVSAMEYKRRENGNRGRIILAK